MIIFSIPLQNDDEKAETKRRAHLGMALNGRAIHRSRGCHFAWFVSNENIQNCHKITINFSTNPYELTDKSERVSSAYD